MDVVEPVVEGEETFPEPFAVGLIEGLFIDGNGYIRSSDGAASDAATIADRLGTQGDEALVRLAETAEQADLAYAFPRMSAGMLSRNSATSQRRRAVRLPGRR